MQSGRGTTGRRGGPIGRSLALLMACKRRKTFLDVIAPRIRTIETLRFASPLMAVRSGLWSKAVAMITIHGISADIIRRNLDDRYRAATEDQRERGLKWYLDARDVVMSAAGDANLILGCEVLAILSPRCPWEVNTEALRRVVSGDYDCPGQCLPRQFARAVRHWERGDEPPTTKKSSDFADCVYYGGLCHSVCLDTHALNAALGRTATTLELGRHFSNAKRGTIHSAGLGAYDALAGIYTEEAVRVGITPAQYQAIVWLVQREGNTVYRTFFRTANSWQKFVKARKYYTGNVYQTEDEARAACRAYNANRNQAEFLRGKKMECEEGRQ